jgi:hypothetical protein
VIFILGREARAARVARGAARMDLRIDRRFIGGVVYKVIAITASA